MNAVIGYWYKDLSKETGFIANYEVHESDIPLVVMGIFKMGYNVMIQHGTKNDIIWVDDKRFGQR